MRNRIITCVFFLILTAASARASHITGGEMFYTYLGMQGSMHQYSVTLKLFQRCASGRVFPNPAIVSIFDKTNNARVTDMNVLITNMETIQITTPDPCITNPPDVCYEVAYYTFVVSLPGSPMGYVIASQVNFRINGINNLVPGSGNVGATYTADIPGTSINPASPVNHSAVFTGSDLVVVCANNNFSYSFAAQDANSDDLRYFFCGAYASIPTGGGAPQPTGPPPFPDVEYGGLFGPGAPLGIDVVVDPVTGLITGIAPDAGIYVVTVCVEEIRSGVVIATQRKDIQIHVADCNVASASLLPEYMLCGSTQTITMTNQSISPLIVTTEWVILDPSGTAIHTSSTPVLTYTFPSVGLYTVKLLINRNIQCTDSTTALVRVFPGFVPDFNAAGICINKPTQFTDLTTSVYGTPDSWSWDLGEPGTNLDLSTVQHPNYTYPTQGIKQARLIVTDTRGCRDTIVKPISIVDKPPIVLAFPDTLICRNDVLQLQASGSGVFSWSPLVNIINPNTATPTVSPVTTTTYYVDLDDNGCHNRDSVSVNVIDFVSLEARADTVICSTDTIRLRAISDGLQYSWTPAGQFIDASAQNPLAITNNTTLYRVTATVGGCQATDSVLVTTVPYPIANAGIDLSICYNSTGVLSGTTDGSSWSWSPANYAASPNALNTMVHPPRTTGFVLSVFDTKGCPKAGRDTVLVTVHPKMSVSAGADTMVVIHQPLQLSATGAISYNWSPVSFLSAANIPNPIALFNEEAIDTRFKVVGSSEAGCLDSAYIMVKVFKTPPSIFVPTAFTPNNDGLNDQLRPIAAGILRIENFSIYNRWGQLLFSTTVNGHGWDGKINGRLQATGTFVWMVRATDYSGKSYFDKGTVTLIR